VRVARTRASVFINSTVIEAYCGIGHLLFRIRGAKILKTFLKAQINMKSGSLLCTTCMTSLFLYSPTSLLSLKFHILTCVLMFQPDFRVAATGSVVELDKSTKSMMKLTFIGTPFKIYRKTAFIHDMISSNLEVAKFEGAKLRTVSGIRAQIKKAISKPEGAFRATFEDKILLIGKFHFKCIR